MVLLAVACGSCSYGADPDRRTDFVVFYDGQSTELDRPARSTVAQAAEAASRAPSLGVVVAGFADPPGAPEANQIQSRIRAQKVADALLEAGVKRDRIKLMPRRALGGDPAAESRRVDIRLGE
ncbi:MAG: OmpA family protein [Acetobacteraceae bacterium]|nr:OmpA family protein [Acetobacteraceae bacterium]